MNLPRWLPVLLGFAVSLSAGQQIVISPTGPQQRAIGKQIVFTCTVIEMAPNVDPYLQWKGVDGRDIIETTGKVYVEKDGLQTLKLYITDIKNIHAGQYTCYGTINGNRVEKTTKLELYKDISFDNAPSPQNPVIFTNAIIVCEVSGAPSPVVSWRRKGITIRNNDKYVYKQNGLQVRNITEEDNGIYECRAEVPAEGRTATKQIYVEVDTPPKIIVPPAPKTEGIEGREVSITCSATGKPAPKYEFFKGNSPTPVASTNRIFVDRNAGRLTFKPLSKDDQDDYKCRAFNRATFKEATGNLYVIVPPRVVQLLNKTKLEGMNEKLTCVTTGDPVPDVKFQKVGNERPYEPGDNENGHINISPDRAGTLTMTINALQAKDTSNYTCIATNIGGTTNANGTVHVEFKPRFEETHRKHWYTWANKVRNITCHALGWPEPQIRWYRGNYELPDNETYHTYRMGRNSALRIRVREEDQGWIYGRYTCLAGNRHGNGQLYINVERARVPDKPEKASVKDESPTMVTLTVLPPKEDGGVAVRGYRVEYQQIVMDFGLADEVIIQNLRPSTTYIFRIRAKNEVGVGNPLDFSHTTQALRKPFPLRIISASDSLYPYSYVVRWEKPRTGGLPIKEFFIRHIRVKVDGNRVVKEHIGDWVRQTVKEEDDSNNARLVYTIKGLLPNTFYLLRVSCRNDLGESSPSSMVFKTAKGTGPVFSGGDHCRQRVSTPLVLVAALAFKLLF